MRPVRLELNGFAGFRTPTVVDFADANYFAVVGPTGSGKSTILDALTFALYGSAYRWGRSNAISYALAPTSNRCTVSLTFDIAATRYQVAREVRRVGQQIQQKAVSLVKFADPNVIVPDPDGPPPEVLAGEIDELNTAIEQLLGLSFEDFRHCVVLPQGDFARFLTVKASERQQVLLKLLGAAQYEGIGKRAGARAAQASTELAVFTDQLGKHADATPEAEAAAQSRVTVLGHLATTVDQLVPRISQAHGRADEAQARADMLRTETTLLAPIRTPDGIEQLQRSTEEADQAVQAARDLADQATQTLADATEAARTGPQRPLLEVASDRYTEQATLTGRRDQVHAAAEAAGQELERRQEDMRNLEGDVTAARDHADDTRRRHERAEQARAAQQQRQQLLAAVRTPADIAELANRAAELDRQEADTREELAKAREQHGQAASALTDAGDGNRLTDARHTLDQLVQATADLTQATGELDTTTTQAAQAEHATLETQAQLDAATAAVDQARQLAGAAQLRTRLEVGHDCPVCEQNVTELPPPLSTPELAAAEAARVAAADHHRHQLDLQKEAAASAAAKQRTVDTLTERRSQLDELLGRLLPERPYGGDRDCDTDRAHLDDLTATREQVVAREQQARQAVDEAEAAAANLARSANSLRKDLDRARSHLHTLLGRLADLNPPTAVADDLATAWADLETWALAQATTVATELAAAAARATETEHNHQDAIAALKTAEQSHRTAQTALQEAVKQAAAADHAKTTLIGRLQELDTLLTQAPPADTLPALLEECTRLEQVQEAAAAGASQARDNVKAANAEHQQWQDRTTTARSQLTATRDKVARLDPPHLDINDLTSAWAALTNWATRAADDRQAETLRVQADAQTATSEAQELLEQLKTLLRDHDLDPGDLGDEPGGAAHASRKVAVAVERAHGQLQQIQHSLADAASLQNKIDDARTRHQVADQLAKLMRANKFPQWLAESALDTLVAGASQSLRQLSGDRFDLSHRRGEFYVIDHFDADSTRSVRTLSGGETFQASLALALALSDQLAGLGGTTKLESIFLDEGFGTLDPDSLETVADTLENLAQGERMVGLITHVAALAERVPVRFEVLRDAHTSTITRHTA